MMTRKRENLRGWLAEILVGIKLKAKLFPEDLSIIRTYREDDHRKIISSLSDPGSGSQALEELDIYFQKRRQN